MRRDRLIALGAAVVLGACKSPRPPREAVESKVTGRWSAESVAVGAPHDSGTLVWHLALEERTAGTVHGRGTRAAGADSTAFEVDGVRGEDVIELGLRLPHGEARYEGSITDPRTIVGEMQLPEDTFPVTFTRP